jgi:cytochrome c-type biogenesis protein CcmE
LEESTVFFHSPSELVNPGALTDRRLRVGGLVEEGSVVQAGATVTFRLTDLANSVPVAYTGILPDLFREGQGVVAEGRMERGVFVADQVLARHDENYMPPEVADAQTPVGERSGVHKLARAVEEHDRLLQCRKHQGRRDPQEGEADDDEGEASVLRLHRPDPRL